MSAPYKAIVAYAVQVDLTKKTFERYVKSLAHTRAEEEGTSGVLPPAWWATTSNAVMMIRVMRDMGAMTPDQADEAEARLAENRHTASVAANVAWDDQDAEDAVRAAIDARTADYIRARYSHIDWSFLSAA